MHAYVCVCVCALCVHVCACVFCVCGTLFVIIIHSWVFQGDGKVIPMYCNNTIFLKMHIMHLSQQLQHCGSLMV